MRGAVIGTVVTAASAILYVQGIVAIQGWQEDRMQEQAQAVVEVVTAPAEETVKESPPEPLTEADGWLVCAEGEWANEDMTACEPLPEEPVRSPNNDPSQTGTVDVNVTIDDVPGPDTVPTCEEGWTLAEDMSCVPPGFYDEPEDVIYEDDPRWNCATMGNLTCGPGSTWEGFHVGEVIVCPPGLEVAIDRLPNGVSWASCQ